MKSLLYSTSLTIAIAMSSSLLGAEVKYYYANDGNKDKKFAKSDKSDNNLLWSVYPPGEENFEVWRRKSVISKGQVNAALAAPMSSPKNALMFALYHDYVENNASEEVFAAYEYAVYNGGNAGRRRGYLAFPDFLIRTKRYQYILDNLNPEDCFQNANICAYYRVAASYLQNGFCEKKWYKAATYYSAKSRLLRTKCRGKVR